MRFRSSQCMRRAVRGAPFAALASLAAALGSPAEAAQPYKQYVLQCPPVLVAPCPPGKVIQCVQRNGQGCCVKSRCKPLPH